MEQHMHCGFCGRAMEGEPLRPTTRQPLRRICDNCASALNVKWNKIEKD